MLKLGFLVSKVVPNPRPSKRLKMLNMMKVKYQVVFSWEELQRFSNRPYSREAFRFVKMLSQNSVLIKAIEEFRRIFCLPPEGCILLGSPALFIINSAGHTNPYGVMKTCYRKKSVHKLKNILQILSNAIISMLRLNIKWIVYFIAVLWIAG